MTLTSKIKRSHSPFMANMCAMFDWDACNGIHVVSIVLTATRCDGRTH